MPKSQWWTAEGAPEVIALREGALLPNGYTYVVCTPTNVASALEGNHMNSANTFDLTTPHNATTHLVGGDVDTTKSSAAARRNVMRTRNKQAHASFAKEMKDLLAGGRPPRLNVSEDQTHLKAHRHTAVKEVAYKILDLRKDGWKGYSMFEKAKVHKELNTSYKFKPPLDLKRVDKYLAGHLRSSRAVWKSHWLRYGDDDRH